jgi:hypothetical protein
MNEGIEVVAYVDDGVGGKSDALAARDVLLDGCAQPPSAPFATCIVTTSEN